VEIFPKPYFCQESLRIVSRIQEKEVHKCTLKATIQAIEFRLFGNYKMPSRSVYSSMESNLTVVTLRNTLMPHVTVITVKTHSLVT